MAEQRLRFLADASMMLAASLDIGETLRELAHAIVPRFADWCTISLRQDDGVVRRVIGVHKDPTRAQAMERYLRGYEPEAHKPSAKVDDQALAAAAQSPDHARILRELGCTSTIVVPLIARGAPVGVLSLSLCDGTREFHE